MHGHVFKDPTGTPLSSIPVYLNCNSLEKLLGTLDLTSICPGNNDSRYLEMANARKGKFAKAIVEEGSYDKTIRTTMCQLVVPNGKCVHCKGFQNQLRATYSRWRKKSQLIHKFSNNRYLNTPQKAKKLKRLQYRASSVEKELKKLKERIASSADRIGISLDDYLCADLKDIIKENQQSVHELFPEGTFKRLFWDQQAQAASKLDGRQMRWHPAMVRWCLNLKLLSSSTYYALRTSGFMQLPCERTLRDYTHFIKSKSGFQMEVEDQLLVESDMENIPEWKKFIVILMDEMKIKENLVYDKHSAEVIGFVDLGNFNEELAELEQLCSSDLELHRPVATHILALMVRGLFMDINFPYAHFPTKNLTADDLFSLVWEAIERLECLGFKVIGVTGDGASPNRKFFRMHSPKKEDSEEAKPCYKTANPYTAENRDLFFFSDVPHLMKTSRNCLSHSFSHGRTRKLWVSMCIYTLFRLQFY